MAEDLVVSGIQIETDALLSGRKTVTEAIGQMEVAASKLDGAMARASAGTKALGEAQMKAALESQIAARSASALRESWRQYQAETNAVRGSLTGLTAAQRAAADPKYARSVAFVRDRLAEMRGGADKARQSTDRLAQSTRQVGDSTGRLDRGISGATTSLRNMATGLIAVFGAAAIVNRALRNMENASRFIVSTNADFQQMSARLRAVTGAGEGGTRKMLQDLQNFARTTPFAVDEVTEAFIRLNQLGAQPTIEKMKGLANVAAFAGAGFQDFSNAIVSAVNTSVEPIRNFGASVIVQNDKLQVSFNGLTETIPRSVEALTDFFARAGQTGRVAGAAAGQMDTLRGRAAGLRTSIIALSQEIGSAGLNAELQDTIQWFDELIQESDDLAVSLGSTAAEGVRVLRGAIEDLLPMVQAAIGLIADLAGVASVPNFGGDIARQVAQSTDIAVLHDTRVSIQKAIEETRKQADAIRRQQEPIRIPLVPEVVNERLGRAQSVFDLARKNVGRLPGVPDDVGVAAREADKELSRLEATIRELEEGLGATKDQIDSIVHPITPPKVSPLGGGTGGTKRTPIDEFAKTMEALAEGRREISAMAAATAGTSIEFNAAEEEASLLEQTIRRLATLPAQYAAQVQATLPSIVERWRTERREIMLTARAEEQRVSQLAVHRANIEKHQEFLRDVTRRQNDMADELAREELQRQREVAESITGSFADAFASVITGTESVSEAFRKMAQEIIAQLVRIQIQKAIIEPLMAQLFPSPTPGPIDLGGPGGGLGQFAAGGVPPVGKPAIVGEKGPELFIPRSLGRIIPNHELGRDANRLDPDALRKQLLAGIDPATFNVTLPEIDVRRPRIPVPEKPKDMFGIRPEMLKLDLPHFAAGGPISAGQPAIVGERGPELFMPKTSGSIVPNDRLREGKREPAPEIHFHNTFEVKSIDSRDAGQFFSQHAGSITQEISRQVERSSALRRTFKR